MRMSKPQISPIIAGCMSWGQWGRKFSASQYLKMIEESVDAGITSFDHADIYGHYTTEEEFGAALAINPCLRNKLQLITKCGIKMTSANRTDHSIKSYNTSKKHILSSVENSLKNLKTDRIEILLIHRPDPLMQPDEIAEAFTYLKKEGKVLHFGVSNFSVSQISLLQARFPVEYHQLEISVLKTDSFFNGDLDQCIVSGIKPMAWGPLGSGLLDKDTGDEKVNRIKYAAGILARKYECSIEQILIAFLQLHPAGIIPVMGTTKLERLKSALNTSKIVLQREDWFLLLEAARGHEVA